MLFLILNYKGNTMNFIKNVLENMPTDWLTLTTHRLDIYQEERAKFHFLDEMKKLDTELQDDKEAFRKGLKELPTAYDYIRLGHPLSSVLEWTISESKSLNEDCVISFSSQTMPILAILRKNLLEDIDTQIVYTSELPKNFDSEALKNVYGYKFELVNIENEKDIADFNGSTIMLTDFDNVWDVELNVKADFIIAIHGELGSITLINGEESKKYISEIQHVRRRESIAMTPHDCLSVLESFVNKSSTTKSITYNASSTLKSINEITNTNSNASLGSCGLSVQYAIMMGLIDNALEVHKGKKIKFIVPPNCYGGTNDQARRVAACVENVEIMDLPVDGGQNMVQSVEKVLERAASEDAVPFIIAEIPTNPRVEVPELDKLKDALIKKRATSNSEDAIAPVFILDQTFCPNVKFLGEGDILSGVKTISYVSGSKFPSGGLCTAGYCVANKEAESLMPTIDKHLKICGNEATAFQVETLSKQMPSMIQRIDDAYKNTRGFVNHIQEMLPTAKINFVSEELAAQGFTPSVFSLDLPAKEESHKRELNLKLIEMMINEIPAESKHCVSYGQLKGCYWTIPATSTQGTTKEGDKDYIVRVAVSPQFDLAHHKDVFTKFCKEHI
jgi:cystathionine beta-lyase/cystathionine gamma-synthase